MARAKKRDFGSKVTRINRDSEFGIRGSEFGVRGSGFGVRGSGFGVRGSGFGIRDSHVLTYSGSLVLTFGMERAR